LGFPIGTRVHLEEAGEQEDDVVGAQTDTFAKIEGAWYFAARTLILDLSETRDLDAPTAA
jgi:hypothetical protein